MRVAHSTFRAASRSLIVHAQGRVLVAPVARFLSNKAGKEAPADEELSLPAALAEEISEEAGNDEVDPEYIDSKNLILKRFKLEETLGMTALLMTAGTGIEVSILSTVVR